jgi:hypothetical protein
MGKAPMAGVQARAFGGSSRESGRVPSTAKKFDRRNIAKGRVSGRVQLVTAMQAEAQQPTPEQQFAWQDNAGPGRSKAATATMAALALGAKAVFDDRAVCNGT